ncbi:MAG: serine/threonine-protein kinase [Planctomycetota bacterium]|jgi:predicted Ser/Thr protein kinase
MSGEPTLRAHFEALVELPADERAAALDALNLGAAERVQLERMLAIDAQLGADDDTVRDRDYPMPGERVGGYRLQAPIGFGGMGSIWLATSQSALEVSVAIKFPAATGVGEDEAHGRLEQERRILSALHHPGVVSLVDAGQTGGGQPYLVLEALEGLPLDRWLREQAPGETLRLEMLAKLVEAVAHVHSRGIVHRDLKPANVMVTPDGWPVLIDFGAARVTEQAPISAAFITQGRAPHTPAFASPEQLRGEQATALADVHALGLLGLEVLDPEAPRSAQLRPLFERACHDDAESRWPSAEALGQALREHFGPERSPARRAAAALPWALLSVALAVTAVLLLNGPEAPDAAWSLALSGVPAAELEFDPDHWLELAESADDPNLIVAAAVQLHASGDRAAARELLHGLEPGAGEYSNLRSIEWAELLLLLGQPDTARACIEALDEDALAEHEQSRAAWLEGRALEDSGHALELMLVAEMSAEWDEEEALLWEYACAWRIARGDLDALVYWQEEEGDAEDLLDLEPQWACALLDLRARLGAESSLQAIDDELLEILEEEAWMQLEEEPWMGSPATWWIARRTRLAALDEGERLDGIEESLGQLAEQDLDDSRWSLPLLVARAHELQRAGDPLEAAESFDRARALAIEVAGEDNGWQAWIAGVQALERDPWQPVHLELYEPADETLEWLDEEGARAFDWLR